MFVNRMNEEGEKAVSPTEFVDSEAGDDFFKAVHS